MRAVFCRLARAAGLAMWLGVGAGAAFAQVQNNAPTTGSSHQPMRAPKQDGFGTADKKQLAPGFEARAKESRLVILPVDMELFSISAGGVSEPRADWTDSAQKNFLGALEARKQNLGSQVASLQEGDFDEMAEVSALHGALAQAIFLHHMQPVYGALPTKDGKLDWSMGDAIATLRQKSGADYALFTWVRDSYASAERKAAIVVMAMFGVGMVGGTQIGYASLVDLKDGRVVWFNSLMRGTGDLREGESAQETVDALLKGFPAATR